VSVAKKSAATKSATPSLDLPAELAEALDASPRAKALFERMPPSHRREHAAHVAEAKKPETRRRRAEAAIPMIMKWGEARG